MYSFKFYDTIPPYSLRKIILKTRTKTSIRYAKEKDRKGEIRERERV